MYLAELDTVRFEPHRNDIDNNYLFAEAAMMKNIIQGYSITLSQTQLFDSGIILKLYQNNKYFAKLFENGVIKVALFDKNRSVKQIVLERLKMGLTGNVSPGDFFLFSGIDAFDKDELYSANPIKNRREPRRIAIAILEGREKDAFSLINGLPETPKQYFKELIAFGETINNMDNPINKYALHTSPVKLHLSEFVLSHLESTTENKTYAEAEHIKKLQEIYNLSKNNIKINLDKRSTYYDYANNRNFCDEECGEKIKSIVDWYYNLIVGQSVLWKSDGIRELTIEPQIADTYDEEIINQNCLGYNIIKNVKYEAYDPAPLDNKVITWKRIYELREMIKQEKDIDKMLNKQLKAFGYNSLSYDRTIAESLLGNIVIDIRDICNNHKSILCKSFPIGTVALGILSASTNISELTNLYDISAYFYENKDIFSTLSKEIVFRQPITEYKRDEFKYKNEVLRLTKEAIQMKGRKGV